MAQVSYALREDSNTIFLLQDAGGYYDKYCQITTFARKLIRPEFFRQYLYFAPFAGTMGKYRGDVTNIQISIEDRGFTPQHNYVAVIDSEVEFRITPSVIRQLCREHMPAWGVKSYLDYFSNQKSGIILFLRIYRVNQSLAPVFLEKGIRGSAQIIKLYKPNGEEALLSIDGITPVISDYKFSYIKDEILHLLKVDNALLALYDNTPNGLNSLQERLETDKEIQGTRQRWRDSHRLQLGNYSDEDDDFDMAQLDYESIFREVLEISPGMKSIIEYAQSIQAARLGEYDYYLKDVHHHTTNEEAAFARLFNMSVRSAIKNALYYYKKNDIELEDAFQEACIGIIMAIKKHTDSVDGLFPSYSSMWMRQIMNRFLQKYDKNVHIPAHYHDYVKQVVEQLERKNGNIDFREFSFDELYSLLLNELGCEKKEAKQLSYILIPAESIEQIIDVSDKEDEFESPNIEEAIIEKSALSQVREAMNSLRTREREILIDRFGFDERPVLSLETVGNAHGITKERVRQIENKALAKIVTKLLQSQFITKEQYDALIHVDEKGTIKLKTDSRKRANKKNVRDSTSF